MCCQRILEIAGIADERPTWAAGLAQESLASGEHAQGLFRLRGSNRCGQRWIRLMQNRVENCRAIMAHWIAPQSFRRHGGKDAMLSAIGWDNADADTRPVPPVIPLRREARKIAKDNCSGIACLMLNWRARKPSDAGA